MGIYTGMIEAHVEDRVPDFPSTLEQFKEQVRNVWVKQAGVNIYRCEEQFKEQVRKYTGERNKFKNRYT